MLYEECWNKAFIRTLSHPDKSQATHYGEILKEYKNERKKY